MGLPDSRIPNPYSALDTLGGAALGIAPRLKHKAHWLLQRLERHHAASYAHSCRVTCLTMAMWRRSPGWLGCPSTALLGSLLHDVGKLYLPAKLLASDLPLAMGERQAIMAHATDGASLLTAHGFPAEIIEIVAHHHERWSGSGYPSGRLASDFAPIVRAVAVADAFTAMTEPGRAYRTPLTHEAARQELECCQGTHFDPTAVAILGRCITVDAPLHPASRASGGRGRLMHVFEQIRRGSQASSQPEAAF